MADGQWSEGAPPSVPQRRAQGADFKEGQDRRLLPWARNHQPMALTYAGRHYRASVTGFLTRWATPKDIAAANEAAVWHTSTGVSFTSGDAASSCVAPATTL